MVRMPRLVPMEELFKGDISIRKSGFYASVWYLSYKLSYRDLTVMMAERGISLPHHDFALGPTLHFGIRQALEPLCSAGRWFMAMR